MAVLSVLSNGQTIYPDVDTYVDDPLIVGEAQRHINGNLRRSVTATKRRISYGYDGLSEALLTTWETAHPTNASFSWRGVDNVTRTVVCLDGVTRQLASNDPGTNAVTWVVSVELEEV